MAMHNDILERLRLDPGHRTLGQLLQDREAAAHEIARLRSDVDRLGASATDHIRTRKDDAPAKVDATSSPSAFRPGSLIRLTDVCELLGMSRSTVYNRLAQNAFPQPVRMGSKSVRWRIEVIEEWRDSLSR